LAVLFRAVWPEICGSCAHDALYGIDGVTAYFLAVESGLAKGGQIISGGTDQEAVFL